MIIGSSNIKPVANDVVFTSPMYELISIEFSTIELICVLTKKLIDNGTKT